ncbi:SLC13 family permease [Vibrio sp. SS-MA-C1-2]|uniref:SLC13 family permease n=1 Tax=Vibrio sp. SS-MA-C1-2 TaxID=2908646 RepID=UPI001F21AFBA|nr:SLC13 family permease [Vibrio sp. SS-MA-C1-2]UJF18005.1 SLC13 family permease [Vibrio sp. SS-MA-C1-2]
MSLSLLFVLTLFILTIICLIRFQKQPATVFGISLITLYMTNQISTEQLILSASNQGVLTLILLLIASIGLEKTRCLNLIAQVIIKPNFESTWLRMFGLTALSSAFFSNTAVVSTLLIPLKNNPYHNASRLLLPLSFAAILGGTLTLVGTSTNLIVNSLMEEKGEASLKFFDFTVIGLAVVVSCGIVLYLLRNRLPDIDQPLLSPEVLSHQNYVIEARVEQNSSLVGQTIERKGLKHLESLFLVEISRENQTIYPVNMSEALQVNDKLIFNGDVTKLNQLDHFDGISLFAGSEGLDLDNLIEVIIRPSSSLIGKTLENSNFRNKFNAAVVAIKRDGEQISGKLHDQTLCDGDYLVLAKQTLPTKKAKTGEKKKRETSTKQREFYQQPKFNQHFILLSDLATETKLSGFKELFTVVGFFFSIFLAALGLVPLFKGLIVYISMMLLLGLFSINELIRRLPINLWLIITSAIGLSYGLQNNHFITFLSQHYLETINTIEPFYALCTIFFCTLILTELVTNNAAAALMFPIAFAVSELLQLNLMPFIMAIAFGGSASFITPYGYQTNLMVFNLGEYSLGDFIKVGLPVSIVYSITAITTIYFYLPLT